MSVFEYVHALNSSASRIRLKTSVNTQNFEQKWLSVIRGKSWVWWSGWTKLHPLYEENLVKIEKFWRKGRSKLAVLCWIFGLITSFGIFYQENCQHLLFWSRYQTISLVIGLEPPNNFENSLQIQLNKCSSLTAVLFSIQKII